MTEIIVVAHNIRSIHNIGSIFRTCEGFGVKQLVLSGYSPYPTTSEDTRLPHISDKVSKQIAKTALGAESMVPFRHCEDIFDTIKQYKSQGYSVLALEQDKHSIELPKFRPPAKVILVLGEEVDGVEPTLLKLCDDIIEIPMFGQKESFNVSVAAGIALYQLRCR
ncbi:MAG: TrmH family RNA methyltransferase [Candidatus Nomurabacteria bacterium]|jgi:tRNA G18 (ribose-2'-O)-methylase SpoU|nr:TrmH family RNA methyltransferase [Candidatus Nomurabacteria bacterium]